MRRLLRDAWFFARLGVCAAAFIAALLALLVAMWADPKDSRRETLH